MEINNHPEVTDTPSTFLLRGSKEITVTTNAKSWNVTSSKTWCTVSKETSHFTVTAAENKAFTPPEKAIVTVTAEGTTQKVTIEVTQDAPSNRRKLSSNRLPIR